MIAYPLLRPFLFQLDAERAHDLTLHQLARWQNTPMQALWAVPRVHDPVEIAGMRFPNRVGLAAGLDKNARCIDAFAAMGFGFIEVGTVTPYAQPGNPRPRMFRLPEAQGIINRFGFNNDGLDAFIANVRRSRLRQQVPPGTSSGCQPAILLGLNIGKNASTPIELANQDYLLGLRGVYEWADYVSINISSPNTQNLRALQNDAQLDALLHAIAAERETLAQQHGRRVPVFVKVAPDLSPEQITVLARALPAHGMDGVIATNTTISRHNVQGLARANETGGLSGGPVREASTAVIAALRHALGPDYPIIGVGGIMSAGDALEKIRAGANLVQLYSGLIYHGPALVGRVAQALKNQFAQPAR